MQMARSKVHDRTTRDVPFNAVVATVEVDDPYPVPGVSRRIKATASLRDDPLGRLYVRRQVSEEDFRAGREWQRLYYMAEIADLRGHDTTREFVDGGRFHDPLTLARMDAADKLARLTKVLGQDGDAIVRDFLGLQLFIKEIAVKRGFSSSDVEYLGRRLRECLGTLALELGYSAR